MYINWRNLNNKSAITSVSNRINVHFYTVITCARYISICKCVCVCIYMHHPTLLFPFSASLPLNQCVCVPDIYIHMCVYTMSIVCMYITLPPNRVCMCGIYMNTRLREQGWVWSLVLYESLSVVRHLWDVITKEIKRNKEEWYRGEFVKLRKSIFG